MNILASASGLSDHDLLARLGALATREREVTVELVAHLAALVARPSLYAAHGYGSLFGYCTQALRLSEDAACSRIAAARTCRRLPKVLDALASGAVSFTAVRMLSPTLTEANHERVLDEPLEEARPMLSPMKRPIIENTSPDRYRVQFTMGKAGHDDLRRLQELLRREIPSGDPAVIVERALALLLAKVEKDKLGATSKPRPIRPGTDSLIRTPIILWRDVPNDVQGAVSRRDGGRCGYVAPNGIRCTERTFLEFHHVHPHALGGAPTVENISLRCRRHNQYEAELVFGPRRSRSAQTDSGVVGPARKT